MLTRGIATLRLIGQSSPLQRHVGFAQPMDGV
jgi:hypothetical protein